MINKTIEVNENIIRNNLEKINDNKEQAISY
jgi:hypothetical protein